MQAPLYHTLRTGSMRRHPRQHPLQTCRRLLLLLNHPIPPDGEASHHGGSLPSHIEDMCCGSKEVIGNVVCLSDGGQPRTHLRPESYTLEGHEGTGHGGCVVEWVEEVASFGVYGSSLTVVPAVLALPCAVRARG